MKALCAALCIAALAGPAAARPLPPDGPLLPVAADVSESEGAEVAIWYWGVLIGPPKFCWTPANGFNYGPWC